MFEALNKLRTIIITFITHYCAAMCSPVIQDLLRVSKLPWQRWQDLRARSVTMWTHGNLLWHLSRDGKSHGSGMSRTTTTSPKPSLRDPWRGGDAVVSRGTLDGQCQREDVPAHARTTHGGLQQKMLEEDTCWIVPRAPPPPTTQSVTGLDRVTFFGAFREVAHLTASFRSVCLCSEQSRNIFDSWIELLKVGISKKIQKKIANFGTELPHSRIVRQPLRAYHQSIIAKHSKSLKVLTEGTSKSWICLTWRSTARCEIAFSWLVCP